MTEKKKRFIYLFIYFFLLLLLWQCWYADDVDWQAGDDDDDHLIVAWNFVIANATCRLSATFNSLFLRFLDHDGYRLLLGQKR